MSTLRAELSNDPEECLLELSPAELLPGDLILVDAVWAVVLDEAMTMHRGLGLFDDFQLFVGTRIEFADHSRPHAWTWEPSARVQVRRRID